MFFKKEIPIVFFSLALLFCSFVGCTKKNGDYKSSKTVDGQIKQPTDDPPQMGSHKAARAVSYKTEQCLRCGKDSDKGFECVMHQELEKSEKKDQFLGCGYTNAKGTVAVIVKKTEASREMLEVWNKQKKKTDHTIDCGICKDICTLDNWVFSSSADDRFLRWDIGSGGGGEYDFLFDSKTGRHHRVSDAESLITPWSEKHAQLWWQRTEHVLGCFDMKTWKENKIRIPPGVSFALDENLNWLSDGRVELKGQWEKGPKSGKLWKKTVRCSAGDSLVQDNR